MRLLLAAMIATALPQCAVAQERLQRCVDDVLRTEGGRVARANADPSLSLRVEPSRDAPIMRSLPRGAPLVVLGRAGTEWLRVIAVDATPGCVVQLGYVAAQYVR